MKVKINNKVLDYRTIWFEEENGTIRMIHQNKPPHKFEIIELKNHTERAHSIVCSPQKPNLKIISNPPDKLPEFK